MSRKEPGQSDADNRVTEYEIAERAHRMKLDSVILSYADHKLSRMEQWVLKTLLAESQLNFMLKAQQEDFELTKEMMREVDLKGSEFLLQPAEWKPMMVSYLKVKIAVSREIFQQQMSGELPKNHAELNAMVRPVKRKRVAAEDPDAEGKTSDSAVGIFRSKPSPRKKPRTTQGAEREATPVTMLQDKSS